MKNLIIWRTTFNLTPEDLIRLDSEIAADSNPQDHDFYTSYMRSYVGEFLAPKYIQEMDKCLKDLNLSGKFCFKSEFWVQEYTSSSAGHKEHHHWSPGTVLSWVHFLRVPETPCFCFTGSDGELLFPPDQYPGTFIVFPPWALHKTIPYNQGVKRLIIAGNTVIV